MHQKSTTLFLFLVTALFSFTNVVAADGSEIRTDVRENLMFDHRIDAKKIIVKANDGNVTLEGDVNSYFELQTAEAIAWTAPGVTSVDNNLEVDPDDDAALPTDREIRASLLDAYLWNQSINTNQIEIGVRNGVVELEGTVDSYWKKIKAQDIAAKMEGVILIENQIAVVPDEDPVDEVIAEQIVDSMERKSMVDASRFDVRVNDGVVTISGSASGFIEMEEALQSARYTSGVVAVVDQINVQ